MPRESSELPAIIGASLNHPVMRQILPGMNFRDERLSQAIRASVAQFGTGRLWRLNEPNSLAFELHRPTPNGVGMLMLQVSGTTAIRADGQEMVTGPGQLHILRANWRDMEVTCHGDNTKIMLELPWSVLVARHPLLWERGEIYSAETPGVRLVSELMRSAARDMGSLVQAQKEVLLGMLAQAAGLPQAGQQALSSVDSRVTHVIAIIDAELQDSGLSAASLAHSQRLSRRRLDQLFIQGLGVSVAGYISSKRLERARELLVDRRHGKASITEVAFAVGFIDSAHFSRAFRARFGLTPSSVRAQGNSGGQEPRDSAPRSRVNAASTRLGIIA